MTFAETLYSYLMGFPGLAALIGTRCYPVKLPQELTLPAITYQQVSDAPEYSHDPGASYMPRVQITCWAETYIEVRALMMQVLAASHGWHSAHGGVAFAENVIDLSEPETGIYQVAIDARFEGVAL